MKTLANFRIYYNQTIYPELKRLELKRKQLLLLLFISLFLLLGIIVLEFYFDIFLITLILMLPIGVYSTFLLYQIRKFTLTFKPRIVNLILDFIGEGKFEYDSKKSIPKSTLIASQLFATSAPYYEGEDFIKGQIGEIAFEMCELNVREFSRVRNRLNYVFKGIFLNAHFEDKFKGTLVLLPREFKQYLTRTIKEFTFKNAQPVSMNNPEFEEAFMTYATPDTHIRGLFSPEMQRIILEERFKSQKHIYVSLINGQMYLAVTEHKDILEPFIFRSNLSFELVREFFEDIMLLFSIVEDFDQNH